jgi:peptidoglycan/xylan/chitin deacetylase (PgdA/CDA1 family)
MPQFEDEVVRGEPLLERAGDGRWFRYPFLQEGRDTARRDNARAWLAARGYRVATVTMTFDDWAWNEPYARCLTRGDDRAIGWLETSYLAAARTAARRSRRAARTAFGRDIPSVLLLHIGAFDARMAPRLLALYRTMGFGFTDLPTAEADPAYAGGEPIAAAAAEPRLAPLRALPAGADRLKARLAATCPAQR